MELEGRESKLEIRNANGGTIKHRRTQEYKW
jgi:hypothetical protein